MLVCLLTWNEQGVHFHQPTARRCIAACPSIFLRTGWPKEFSEFERVNWIPPCQNHQLKTQLKSCKNQTDKILAHLNNLLLTLLGYKNHKNLFYLRICVNA